MTSHRPPVIDTVPGATRITMHAERSALLLAAAVGWLALGAALIAASALGLADASSPDRWWSLIVLALGLANAVPAVMLGAFTLAGREVVEVGPLRLTWRRDAFGVGRTRVFEGPVSHVYNRGIRLSGAQCFLVFHVGKRIVRLGTGMTEAEAAGIVDELRNRYPEMRPEGFVPRHPRMG